MSPKQRTTFFNAVRAIQDQALQSALGVSPTKPSSPIPSVWTWPQWNSVPDFTGVAPGAPGVVGGPLPQNRMPSPKTENTSKRQPPRRVQVSFDVESCNGSKVEKCFTGRKFCVMVDRGVEFRHVRDAIQREMSDHKRRSSDQPMTVAGTVREIRSRRVTYNANGSSRFVYGDSFVPNGNMSVVVAWDSGSGTTARPVGSTMPRVRVTSRATAPVRDLYEFDHLTGSDDGSDRTERKTTKDTTAASGMRSESKP